jgi:hypothetical protein
MDGATDEGDLCPAMFVCDRGTCVHACGAGANGCRIQRLREWVRTLRGQGRNWSMGSLSRAWAVNGISCRIHMACL